MDTIIGILAIACFVAFVAVLAVFVPEWDLMIVLAAAVLMAVWDFWRALRSGRG
ncbi:hypothetical protein [Microvirga roseola]|uniref:hypothetical protein n=1 Tax=Microvirga roseola TaxID=2883126 RepID=UPI001E3E6413|nr:hypothetical protein [Microvirga roseola]